MKQHNREVRGCIAWYDSHQHYPAYAMTPHLMDLLYVSREIRREATPIYFRQVLFLFDIGAHRAMDFLSRLGERLPCAVKNITSIGFTDTSIRADKGASSSCWHKPEHSDMNTMFVAFLSVQLPALQNVAWAARIPITKNPDKGTEEIMIEDLQVLLYVGRLKTLQIVYTDLTPALKQHLDDTSPDTNRPSSVDVFQSLLGNDLWFGEAVLCYDFDRKYPRPGYPEAEDRGYKWAAWVAQRDLWTRSHSCGLRWRWGSRELLTGQDGFTIHAVIEMSIAANETSLRHSTDGTNPACTEPEACEDSAQSSEPD